MHEANQICPWKMENLQNKIKELGGNLSCEKVFQGGICLSLYEIKERCELSSTASKNLDEYVEKAIQHYNISTEKRKRSIFTVYGPTPQECLNFNCIVPFILWEFGEHHEFQEYMIQQQKEVDNFKWFRGIPDMETAWELWTFETEQSGLTHNDWFRIDYFKKHPNSTLKH